MVKKKDIDDLVTKCQPVLKRTGDQFAKAVKVAEEDLAKIYQKVQTHIEIQMKNLKKEKLYYDIGKYVADSLEKGKLDQAALDKFKKELEKIDSEGRKMKKKLVEIDKKKKSKPAKVSIDPANKTAKKTPKKK